MVDLFLQEITEKNVTYKYAPEGKENEYGYGLITIDKTTGELELVKRDPQKWEAYVRHAVLTIHKFYKQGFYPEKYTVLWY